MQGHNRVLVVDLWYLLTLEICGSNPNIGIMLECICMSIVKKKIVKKARFLAKRTNIIAFRDTDG